MSILSVSIVTHTVSNHGNGSKYEDRLAQHVAGMGFPIIHRMHVCENPIANLPNRKISINTKL